MKATQITGRPERPVNYLTVLNVLSAVAVVYLHANGIFWTFSDTEPYWRNANVIESVFYFAVPVFFMLSGANLIDYRDRYTTKAFFKKRAVKTLIPFLAWTVLGTVYRIVLREIPLSSITPRFLLSGFLNSDLVRVYWFFFPLFCVYLCIPLFSAVPKEKRKSVFTYLSVLCFAVNCLIPFLIRVFSLKLTWPISVSVVSGYLIYTLTGYLLKNDTPPRSVRVLIYLLAAVGLALQIVGTYRLSMAEGKIVEMYKGYYNVPCVMYSVGVFLAGKQLGEKLLRIGFFRRGIAFLGRYTFPIYLMHWYVLHLLVKLDFIDDRRLWYRLCVPLVVIPVCILAAAILRKIPVLRRIVP